MPVSGKANIAITAVLLLIFTVSYSQSVKIHQEKADRYFLKKDYKNALKSYQEALTGESGDALALFRAGISSLKEEYFSQAVGYLEKAYQLQADIDEALPYHLGVAYQKDHQFGKARQQFETLKSQNKRMAPVANRKIHECILGDSLMKIAVKAEVSPLPGEVNTAFSESSPVIRPDGSLLFTSNRTADEYQIKSGTNSGDVYTGKMVGKSWTSIQKIGDPINVKLHESATSISSDGKTLFLYYEDGGGDIYTSSFEGGVWSRPVALNKFVNHPQYKESSACISADGKKLYFSSNRPGGKGGFDIYVCEMTANGQWGRPTNLGSAINTRGDEESPFISGDGETLYFSSDGHATLGDKDIFMSSLSQGKFLPPRNLGYPINTSGYEADFVLSPDGSMGYFASRRSAPAGNTDIYEVTFLASADHAGQKLLSNETPGGVSDNIKAVAVLKGSVTDASTGEPLQVTLSLVDNIRETLVTGLTTDSSGNFEIMIPREGNYGVTTEREGYLFNSMNFRLPALEKYQEIEANILMVKATVGSKVVLKNIFFDLNQSALKPESFRELQNIKDLLLQNPTWRIRINGHTDNVGPRDKNIALSLERAEAVVEYLVKQGISRERLQAKGFGPDQPLVSNDDERDGRQLNRRTEVEIIGQ